MTPFLVAYITSWSAFCLVSALIAWRSVKVSRADALAFLVVPWKVALFAPAILFVTAFTRADWPRPLPAKRQVGWPLVLASLPLVGIAAYFLVAFVGWRVPR